MTERCWSFDLEWEVARANRLVCLQHCELFADGTTSAGEVVAAWPGEQARARELVGDVLASPDWIILGQNVAGDLMRVAREFGLLREVDAAYRAGRVRDTMIAQRLLDVGWPGYLVWKPLGVKAKKKGKKRRAEDEVDPDELDETQVEEVGGQKGMWTTMKRAPHALLGELIFEERDEGGGKGQQAKAGLEALAARYLGIDLSKVKKDANSVRRRYGEMIGIPVADWPPEFLEYAREDPVLTARVRAEQLKRPRHPYDGPWVDVLFREAPPGCAPWAPLRCERFECYYAFSAADLEIPGVVRDQPRVEALRATLARVADSLEDVAVRSGVVRCEVTRDAAAAFRSGLVKLEVKHDAAAGKAAGLTPAEVREVFRRAREAAADGRADEVRELAAAHPWLTVVEKLDAPAVREAADEAIALAGRRDLAGLEAFVASRPWLSVARKKATDEITSRALAAYKAAGVREIPRTPTGEVQASAEHLVHVIRAREDADPEAAADLQALLGIDMLRHLQAWADSGDPARIARAAEAADDPGLAAHVLRGKAQGFDTGFLKALDTRHRRTDPDKWRDPEGPARFGVSTFKATARTGLRGDVRQNMPKSGGVRECFIPRPGRAFICVDFAAFEMSTLADALDSLVVEGLYGKRGGISRLGEAVRKGDDCHLLLASNMRREPYEQLVAFYKPLKKKIEENGEGSVGKGELRDWRDLDLDRAGAKEGNFGYGGGMGAKKFARLQRKKGRSMTEERARQILEAWLETWSPEILDYRRLASDATGDRNRRRSATVVHMRGGHVRGGLDFCAWLNTHFQELAARAAKRAGLYLYQAAEGLIDSVLAGPGLGPTGRRFDPVLFVHDEYVCEADLEIARLVEDLAAPRKKDGSAQTYSPAQREVQRLMELGASEVVRTPVRTEGKVLFERWVK